MDDIRPVIEIKIEICFKVGPYLDLLASFVARPLGSGLAL